MTRFPSVYILASVTRVLYIGVKSNPEARIFQHKAHLLEGFTKTYHVTRLVHFEEFGTMEEAIAREKQLKKWNRIKKIALIEEVNPEWKDMAADWWPEDPVVIGKLAP